MDISDEDDAGLWQEGEKKVSKIVFIGKSLDQDFFRKCFDGLFDDGDGPNTAQQPNLPYTAGSCGLQAGTAIPQPYNTTKWET